MKRILLLALLMLGITTSQAQVTPGSPDNFITVWNTLATTEITIPADGSGYDYHLYWEQLDNPFNNGNLLNQTSSATITNLIANTDYRIEIIGDFPRFSGINYSSEAIKVKEVSQWGSINWFSMYGAFYGSSNLNISATDSPDLSSVDNMSVMFFGCSSLTGNGANWNWDTENVTDMSGMFWGASLYNQDIGNWNVSNVTLFNNMFRNASSFNQNISLWNTSNATDMLLMFRNAAVFNQNIGSWNTENVLNMSNMFENATSFNQDISGWNTANVTNMSYMFSAATAFNQDISGWNTANVTTMNSMFNSAASFNQNIGSWNYTNTINMSNMFDNSGIDCETYGDMLSSWGSGATLPMSLTIGVLGLNYTDGDVANRNFIISENGITFSGDINVGATCNTASFSENFINQLSIFPNPGSNLVNLIAAQPTTAVFTSANGAILAHLELNGESNTDVSTYAPGVYFIRTAEGQTVKFIKE